MRAAADTPGPAGPTRESIARLVARFYDDVRADDVLGPTFEAALADRWATHLPRMVEFWCTVALGSRSFSGNVYARHMALPGITPTHFERWMRLWALNTRAMFDAATAARLQQLARGIARSLYLGTFGDTAGFDVIASQAAAAAVHGERQARSA